MRKNEVSILGLIITLLFQCRNPFSTRESEPPVERRSSWIPPSSPDDVMVNLCNSFTERNVRNYLKCLVDTSKASRRFRFVPDQSVANENPGFFDDWELEKERNYLNQLFAVLPPDSISRLSLEDFRESSSQDTTILVKNYELIVHHLQTEGDYPREAKGQVEFWLIRDQSNLWSIYHWIDTGTGDYPSWSSIKAKFGK